MHRLMTGCYFAKQRCFNKTQLLAHTSALYTTRIHVLVWPEKRYLACFQAQLIDTRSRSLSFCRSVRSCSFLHTRFQNIMKLSNLILVAAVAGCSWSASTTTTTLAFVPSNNYINVATIESRGQRYARRSPVVAATIEKESTLTEEDEEILFGGSPDSHVGQRVPLAQASASLNPLDRAVKDPLVNDLFSMRKELKSCPDLWRHLDRLCPDSRALLDEHMCDTTVDVTFREMNTIVRKSAAIFQKLGVTKGVNVAILGENSARWLMVDHGIQLAGGASAVRGADAPLDELRYIYEHSDSRNIAVMQGPKLLRKLASSSKNGSLGLSNQYGECKTVILLNREKTSEEDIQSMAKQLGISIQVFADMLDVVEPLTDAQLPDVTRQDLATIVYTSGTTGSPKGVMLTHDNLIHQVAHRVEPTRPYEESEPLPGETMLSLLPVWHITERTFELWMLSRGSNVVYSSIRTFKNDLAKHKPQWAVLVPRVLEKVAKGVQDKFASGSLPVKALSSLFTKTSMAAAKHRKIAKGLVVADSPPGFVATTISKVVVAALTPLNVVGNRLVWSKVQDGFGGRMRCIMSGGSALAGALDEWYEAAGFKICVAYGLTECSPLISHRRGDANLVTAGCAGRPCVNTDLRVVDPDSKVNPEAGPQRPSVPMGEVGVVIARGPQVMKGYYKNPEETAKAIDRYGFFDTGDLGRINPATGDLILTGRAKDTIVLSNGENIEPGPIEDAIVGDCSLIEQVMLVGQDGKSLTAIAVLNPSELGNEGFLDKGQAAKLQKLNEKVNDPKCSEEECASSTGALNAAVNNLRTNAELKSRLASDCRKATQGFRKWEQVRDVFVTLEPFAMANGQLTQSYKVKKASVLERYQDEI